MKKVLVVTYYWPPSGGPGVQRILKFCKYLPEFGWEPIVLTVKNGDYPNLDYSLEQEVEDLNIRVIKTKTFELFNLYKLIVGKKSLPSFELNQSKKGFLSIISRWLRINCFIPDARKGWIPYGVTAGRDLLTKENIKLIFSSGPPHSLHFIAKKLKEESKIPWVADFRDPWTDLFYLEGYNRLKYSEAADLRKEMQILSSADIITTVSPSIHILLMGKNLRNNVEIITNGYDENDFLGIESKDYTKNSLIISYVGSMAKSQIPKSFFMAMCELKKKNIPIKIQFIGNVHPEAVLLIEKLEITDQINFIGYVSHNEAIKYMSASNYLLLVVPNTSNNKGIITGKVFEYLRSKSPVICIAPTDSDVAKIIHETQGGFIFNYDDSKGIVDLILDPKNIYSKNIYKYDRKELTGQLCQLFSNLVN